MLILFCLMGIIFYLVSGEIITMICCIIAVVISAFVEYEASVRMQMLVRKKGYEKLRVQTFCFWFGILGYMYVVALPDLVLRRKIDMLLGDDADDTDLEEDILGELFKKSKKDEVSVVENENDLYNDTWTCKYCGRIHSNGIKKCRCKKSKEKITSESLQELEKQIGMVVEEKNKMNGSNRKNVRNNSNRKNPNNHNKNVKRRNNQLGNNNRRQNNMKTGNINNIDDDNYQKNYQSDKNDLNKRVRNNFQNEDRNKNNRNKNSGNRSRMNVNRVNQSAERSTINEINRRKASKINSEKINTARYSDTNNNDVIDNDAINIEKINSNVKIGSSIIKTTNQKRSNMHSKTEFIKSSNINQSMKNNIRKKSMTFNIDNEEDLTKTRDLPFQ